MGNSKELYNEFEKALALKIEERDIKIRKTEQQKEERKKEEQRIATQKIIDLEIRKTENKKILQDAGIEDLFQEIIDKGIVEYSRHPFIVPNAEGRYVQLLYDDLINYRKANFCRIDVLSNKKIGFLKFDIPDDGEIHCYIEEERLFRLTKNGSSLCLGLEYEGSGPLDYAKAKHFCCVQPTEIEITNIPDYVAGKILEPDVYS